MLANGQAPVQQAESGQNQQNSTKGNQLTFNFVLVMAAFFFLSSFKYLSTDRNKDSSWEKQRGEKRRGVDFM